MATQIFLADKTTLDSVKTDTTTIKNQTDTLEGALGQTTDSASATGSANAKLKDIKSYLTTNLTKAFKGTPKSTGGAINSAADDTTCLSITGKGWLLGIANLSDSGNLYYVAKVDGVLLNGSGDITGITGVVSAGNSDFICVRFETSLLVTANSASYMAGIRYILD